MKAPLAALGEVADFIRGITFKPNDIIELGAPNSVACLRTKNVQTDLDLTDIWALPESFVKSPDRLARRGDVILSTANSWNLVGKASWVPELPWPTTAGGFVSLLRAKSERLDPRYMYHWTSSPLTQARLRQCARRTTNISNLSIPQAKELTIPLPPLEEQKRIAGILDQAAELCCLRARALDKLNTLGQAIFHEMFSAAKPVLRAVGQLGDVQGGLQVTTKRDAYEFRAPYLRVANVYRDRLELCEIKTIGLTEAEAQRTTLNPGDVLIVEGHGNPAEIGRMAVWNGEITSCVHQNHLIRFRPNQSQILPQFFSSYMNSHIGRQHLTSSARTTSGLNTISTKKVKECVIPVPDLKSQRSFLSGYEAVRHQSSVFVRQLAKQETLFASLQHRAFRGEL